MKKSHNKKRNVGIIYELLLRNVSDNLIEGKTKEAQKALDIIQKRFDKSTELYKEFRLFNALAKSTVSNTAIAAAILNEAKNAARNCNQKSLSYEKSMLIKDINYNLKDESFYRRRIPEYKIYATIQTLLNDWRQEDRSDLSRMIQYESLVAQHLVEEKGSIDISDVTNPDVDGLVVKIMSEKINKKYGSVLTPDQKSILQEYVFSMSEENEERIVKKLLEVKDSVLRDLESFKVYTTNNTLLQKISEVEKKIISESSGNVSDESISRFLVLVKLKEEIKEALNERK